jgi:hypothetical protein
MINLIPFSSVQTAQREGADREYLVGMNESTDLLAEAIWRLANSSLTPENGHEAACRAVAPHLLTETRSFDEDVVMTAWEGFCARDLGRLLAEHQKNPAGCAKVLRANFRRLLRWRQRDLWRRENRRRAAEEGFGFRQVHEAYEGDRELSATAVLAEAAEIDPEIARLLPQQGELRSLDELHGRLAAALRCSKATARRRLLALGQRLRALIRRESGRFFADHPASHLPAGTGACSARVIRSVFAAA